MKTLSLSAKKFLSSVTARWGTVLLLSALLGSFGPQTARAQEASRVAGVYRTKGLTFRVWGCNFTSQPGRVRLIATDEADRVLYQQHSSATNLGGQFDLRQLPDGHYAFLIKIGAEEHRFDLHLHSNSERLVEISDDRQPADPRLVSAALREKQ